MVVGEFTQETDLVVIGGGPAGYTAAFRAAELGVSTVIVDSRPALGGVCLHEGCIPSKTLLHIAQTIGLGEHAAQFGVSFAKPKVDLDAVRAWKGKTIAKLAAGLESLCKKRGVDRIEGRAHFESSRSIAVLDSAVPRVRFRRALIATGSLPRVHPELPFDGARVLTAAQMLALESVPKRLLVFGNDYQAVELAEIFAVLGSSVTLAHDGERLLPEADADLVRPLAKRLESMLKGLYQQVRLSQVAVKKDGVKLALGGDGGKPEMHTFDAVVLTTAHIGNTRDLQLEKTGVLAGADGFLAVDERMRTADPRIFAIGDCTGGPLLADKAIAQGRVAAEAIAGREHTVFDARAIPACVFTDPQIAWVGSTEESLKRDGSAHAVAKVPWGASGRAVGMGRADGLTKILYELRSRLVLGIGLVGPQACEMIGECALAIEMGAVVDDLAATLHPHPTMGELLGDAARQVEQP